MKKILAILGCALAVVLMTSLFGSSIQAGAAGEGQKTQQEIILELQNAYRVQAGLKPLKLTTELQTAANIRASEASTFFSHMRPDGSEWWTVDPERAWGENLYSGQNSAERIVSAWMNSRYHYENVMDPDFRTCGIGLVYANGRWYCVQEFGY